jgi:Big-like domain-containing protein
MPPGGRRLSPCTVVIAIIALVGCQSGARGGESGDSIAKTPVADTSHATSSGVTRTDSVVLRTDKTQYRAGEKVMLTFENKSAASYAFNPCTRTLEREDGSAWTAIPDEGRMCTMEAWILDPRATRTGPTELPASLTAGRYRVLVRMTIEGGGTPSPAVTAISDPISVVP